MLALSTGQCTETVKASGRARFPWRERKSCLSPREGPKEDSCQAWPAEAPVCSLCSGEREDPSLGCEASSFLPTTKITQVAAQTGKLKRSGFPAPAASGLFFRVRKKGEHVLSCPYSAFRVPRVVLFCAHRSLGSWEPHRRRFFSRRLILH